MSAKNTRQAKSAAPAVYSALQVEAICSKIEAANSKVYAAMTETISEFKEIMAKQDHQLMQFRGLCALAKGTGVL